MASSLRAAPALLVAVVLLTSPACREVSQPALDGPLPPDGLFPVEQDGDWGYITGAGSLAIAPRFERAYRFVDNRALVRRDGRYGFIDTSGAAVIPPIYAGAWHFSEGLAPVRPDSLWGFVDRTGTLVIEPQFRFVPPGSDLRPASGMGPPPRDSVGADTSPPTLVPSPAPHTYFPEGRARIRVGRAWGYVDRQGAPVIAPRFARAERFRGGLARVQFPDGDPGYIARDGTVVWPPGHR